MQNKIEPKLIASHAKNEWDVCLTVDTTASVVVKILAQSEDEAHDLAFDLLYDSPQLRFDRDDFEGKPYVSWAQPSASHYCTVGAPTDGGRS